MSDTMMPHSFKDRLGNECNNNTHKMVIQERQIVHTQTGHCCMQDALDEHFEDAHIGRHNNAHDTNAN